MTSTDTALTGLHILIVDDDEMNRRLLQLQLHALGCQVDMAVNGAEGVQAFVTEYYDAVLMDMEMPELSGPEAAQAIRAHEADTELPRVPLIALSGHQESESIRLCKSAGMDDFLVKPVNKQTLQDTLLHWIAR